MSASIKQAFRLPKAGRLFYFKSLTLFIFSIIFAARSVADRKMQVSTVKKTRQTPLATCIFVDFMVC